MGPLRSLAPVAALALLGSCGDGDPTGTTAGSAPPAPTSTTATTRAEPPAAGPVDGRAVVVAGDQRFEFVVEDCLVGEEQTGTPYQRLSVHGSETVPYAEAQVFLAVRILVSQVVAGHEEHLIEITRMQGEDLGAADVAVPSRGGPAPDDWIEVGDGAVTGSGFRLRSTGDPVAEPLPAGDLVVDCPEDR